MGMNIPIGEKPHQVKSATSARAGSDDALPALPLPNATAPDRGKNKTRPLLDDPTRAERIVTDFAVSHVVVGGHPHGGSVGTERPKRSASKSVQSRCSSEPDGISFILPTHADAVEDDQKYGALSGASPRVRLQVECHLPLGWSAVGRFASRVGAVARFYEPERPSMLLLAVHSVETAVGRGAKWRPFRCPDYGRSPESALMSGRPPSANTAVERLSTRSTRPLDLQAC